MDKDQQESDFSLKVESFVAKSEKARHEPRRRHYFYDSRTPEPSWKQSASLQVKKHQVVIEEKQREPIDLKTIPPAPSLDDLDWTKCKNFMASSAGSSGVFFVQSENGIVVVKGGKDIVQEVFATRCAELMGIKAPKLRVIERAYGGSASSDQPQPISELQKLQNSIFGLAQEWEIPKITRELVRPFVLAIKFIPGKNLESFDRDSAKLLFSESGVLRGLGRLLAVDVYLNNVDRMPLGGVWGHEGNPGNILITPGNQVVAIDNNCCTLDAQKFPENAKRHFEKVNLFLENLISKTNVGEEYSPGGIHSVREFIFQFTGGHDIGVSGSLEIQKGMIEQFNQIGNHFDFQKIRELFDQLGREVVENQEGVWKLGVASIHISFLKRMHEIVQLYFMDKQ